MTFFVAPVDRDGVDLVHSRRKLGASQQRPSSRVGKRQKRKNRIKHVSHVRQTRPPSPFSRHSPGGIGFLAAAEGREASGSELVQRTQASLHGRAALADALPGGGYSAPVGRASRRASVRRSTEIGVSDLPRHPVLEEQASVQNQRVLPLHG